MSMIVDAVVAGAAAGSKDVATAAVKDAYARLATLLAGRLTARPQARAALAEVETRAGDAVDQAPWRDVLEAELVETGVATADDVLLAARELLELVHRYGTPKYGVDASHAQGLQIGDHNSQTNNFGTR